MENNSKDTKEMQRETSLDDKKYQNPEVCPPAPNTPSDKEQKEMEKVKEKLESLKKYLLNKYKFIEAIGIIPPQAAEMFDEENELPEEEKKNKPMHLAVILPDDKEKEFNEIKKEIVKKIQDDKQKIWLNLFLERDLWEICMDSKYNIIEAIGMCFPLFDKGILGALRVAQIHKSLVLRKFEKYVYSYVIGGSLVRGEAKKTSDVDVYIIIDDTDVKRMPRLELKEKLRNIIYSYVMQAGELAGVQNKLSPQIYLLTEFWEGVKDANPIFFTFIRDGSPLYDRGGFLPWKLLLRMGKIKPSPESIDGFMSVGDKTTEIAKRKLLDIVIGDIYWGVSMPTQGLLMLYGLPPTNVPETVREFRRIFVEKEKLVDKKYADILEEIMIKYYKGYEHEKVKEVDGKTVDRLLANSKDYLERLKKLREDIEKEIQKKSLNEIHENIFKILRSLFGDKPEKILIKDFEKELVNKAMTNPRYIHILRELVEIKEKSKAKKLPTKQAFENLRKDSFYLIEDLIEFAQRKDLGLLEKTKVTLEFKDKQAELFLLNHPFLVIGDKIKKIIDNKIHDSDPNEFTSALNNHKPNGIKLESKLLDLIKKEIGDFHIKI